MRRKVLLGERFGKLEVIDYLPDHLTKSGERVQKILVKCDCGRIKELGAKGLLQGRTQCWYCSHKKDIKYRVGDRYDKVVIKKFFREEKANKRMAVCQCDCGKETIIFVGLFNRGKVHNCGCSPANNYKGCGNLSGLYFYSLRSGAERRNISFEVTKEQLWELLLKQNKKCALTGLPIELCIRNKSDSTASLDRIDSKKGYTLNNVQWVHKDINRMKQNLDQNRFLNLCIAVHNYQKGISNEDISQEVPISRPRFQKGRKPVCIDYIETFPVGMTPS
jgi:hypothetical protein